jgi:hypothetical protein
MYILMEINLDMQVRRSAVERSVGKALYKEVVLAQCTRVKGQRMHIHNASSISFGALISQRLQRLTKPFEGVSKRMMDTKFTKHETNTCT